MHFFDIDIVEYFFPRSYNRCRCQKYIILACNNYSFDVIHSQTDTGAFGLACKIAKKMNIPHVHTFHTNMAGAHLTAPINSFLGSIGYRAGALKAYLTNRKYELCKLDK